MSKAEIVDRVASKANMTKAVAERVLGAFLETIIENLKKEEKLTLTGFGTFSVESRGQRKGRNPRTGEEITIPASRVVKFRPGKMLKDSVDSKSS